jgi:cob(I)alamin adenosyltransferase
MKIYTKNGDQGLTSLIGGTRVPKHTLRIEAYGTVDELMSHIGLVRDQDINTLFIEQLLHIQDRLFTIGSHLASDPEKSKMKLPEIYEEDVTWLEQKIDQQEMNLPPMKSFILPGGHTTVSYCHIARCVCRRAERLVEHLNSEQPVNPLLLKYLNRLSDYLFVLSRSISQEVKAKEIPWKPIY